MSSQGLLTARDLLTRAYELEQLASLVSYGADKVRLKERAGRLRAEARLRPADAATRDGMDQS
ncbi:MAG TPA: hypothetical protein VGM25_10500 [Caulobacteraceae bacterium]